MIPDKICFNFIGGRDVKDKKSIIKYVMSEEHWRLLMCTQNPILTETSVGLDDLKTILSHDILPWVDIKIKSLASSRC